MSRRRRGRRRPWEERDGSGPSRPPGIDPETQPLSLRGHAASSQNAPRGYAGAAPGARTSRFGGSAAQTRRWQPGAGERPRGNGPRAPRGGSDGPRRREDLPRPTAPAGLPIDPFELFCAYHLGITADDGYRIQNIHEVARRFGTNAAALRQTLAAYGMDADDMVHSGFDLSSAQIDIMVAPPGISRRELARPWFEEFRGAPRQARDWRREMEAAERVIAETIGRDGRWSPAPRDRAGKQS